MEPIAKKTAVTRGTRVALAQVAGSAIVAALDTAAGIPAFAPVAVGLGIVLNMISKYKREEKGDNVNWFWKLF